MVEPGIYKIPLVLPESLEAQRGSLEQSLLNAQRRLREFALGNGWGHFVEERFAHRAEIYDDQRSFVQALLTAAGADSSTELPKEVSAALEKGVFMSVSPAVYSRIYPEGIEEAAFEKLIAHEMAHRLHIRILGGNEDAMGPTWFFEGFAIYAAGQFSDASLPPDEVWKVVRETERGSYRRYAAVMRHFLKRTSIQDLVTRAGDGDFLDWLARLEP